MTESQDCCNWKQTLIYSIEMDRSAEYETDKIVFHCQNLKFFFSEYSQPDQVKIYGMYGHYIDIEHYIRQTYPNMKEFRFLDQLLNDEKGKIVFVQMKSLIIPCLLLPLSFFLKRPINEKAIELTLFRILQDISSNIIVCMNENVLRDWYIGQNTPFSYQHSTKLKQYKIEQCSKEEIEIKLIQLNSFIPEGFSEWQVLPNSTYQSQFLLYNQMIFTNALKIEFETSLQKTLMAIIHQLFKNNQMQLAISLLDKHLRQEFLTEKVCDKLQKIITYLSEEISNIKRNIIDQLYKSIQEKRDSLKNLDTDSLANFLLQHIEQHLIYDHGNNFKFSNELQFPKNYQSIDVQTLCYYFGLAVQSCREQLNRLFDSFKYKDIKQIIEFYETQELNENNFIIQRCKFSTIREMNKENNIEKLSISATSSFIVNIKKIQPDSFCNKFIKKIDSWIGKDQKEKLRFVDFLTSKADNQDILILQKNEEHLIVLVGNNGQLKVLRSIKNLSQGVFLFISEKYGSLFAFNYRSTDAVKLAFNEGWSKPEEIVFFNCQPYIWKKVVWMSYDKSFISITLYGDVFKWRGTKDPFQKINRLNLDTSKISLQSSVFNPTKPPGSKYIQLEACPSGKQFLLSNQEVIDIYDINHQLVKTLEITNKYLMYADKFDAFIISQNQLLQRTPNATVIAIPNISNQQMIKEINSELSQDQKLGNPFLDIIKGSNVKYGPCFQNVLIGNLKKIDLSILNFQNKRKEIQEYLKFSQIDEFCNYQFFENENQEWKDAIHEFICIEQLQQLSFSRVPLQFCTIENNQLIPLIDGFRQGLNRNQSLTIPQRAKLLKLGYIEEYLMNLNEKIFIVSIIGRQSSGKSYLLNRLFGTRFTVAASRCTDGIWASIIWIDNKSFLILDCEGLFSPQRTENEETQLLAFLAAICDVTILNQDLSFNRNLDKLLDNLSSATGRLQGESLFKGSLLIALRDISGKDSDGANEQLLQNIGANIRSRSTSFLNILFSGSFDIFLFSNFENIKFSKEIEDLRNHILQLAQSKNRWLNGKDLIQTLKILLIQLETQDEENTDDLQFRFQLDDTVDKLKRNWIKLEDNLQFEFLSKQYLNKNYILLDDNENLDDRSLFYENLVSQISSDLELSNQIVYHNANLLTIQDFLNELIKQRKEYLLQEFEKKIFHKQMMSNEHEIVKHQRTNLTRYIEEQERLYQFCIMQCSHCFLNCSKFINHSNMLQKEINKKDSLLQNLRQKYSEKLKQFLDSDDQYNKSLQNAELVKRDIDLLDQEIFSFQKFLDWLQLNENLQNVIDQLVNTQLVDRVQPTILNFIKMVFLYDNFKLVNPLDQEFKQKILNIEAEFLTHKDIYQFIRREVNHLQEQKKVILVQIQKDSRKVQSFQDQEKNFIKKRLSSENQIQDLHEKIQMNQELLIIQQEKKLEQFQKIEKLMIKEKELKQGLIDCQSFVVEGPIETYSTKAQVIQYDIKKAEAELQNMIAKAQKIDEQLQQLSLRTQENITQFQLSLQNIQDQEFKIRCNEQSLQYNELKVKLSQINEELEIIQTKQKGNKSLKQEFDKISKRFKIICLEKYQTFAEAKDALNKEKENIRPKIEDLENTEDIELKQSLLEDDEEICLKEVYILKKIEEIKRSFYEESNNLGQMLKIQEDQNRALLKHLKILKQVLDYYNNQIQLNEIKISYQSLQGQIENLNFILENSKGKTNQLEQDLQNIDKQINLIIEDRFNIQKEIDLNQKDVEKLNSSIQNFFQGNQQYENCINFQQQYDQILSKMNALLLILNQWQDENYLHEKSHNKQFVEEKLTKLRLQLDDTKAKQIICQQEIQELRNQRQDQIIIQQLQEELILLKNQEKSMHSCLKKSHSCDQACFICGDTKCNKKAGHQKDHICELPTHYCNQICSIMECGKLCRKQYLHDGQHSCENPHLCKFPCQYCGGSCQFEYTQQHIEHSCQIQGCIQKCILCARRCKDQHSHSRQAEQVHFCENIHSCIALCSSPGVCVWEYIEEKKTWKSAISSFDYTYFKLVDGGKQCCTISIQAGFSSHGENHKCKTDAHKCGVKCPECEGLCTKTFGHDGFHFAKQHRNKDNQIFTLTIKQGTNLEFDENLETHKYQVGESSSPETCTESCSRRSRAHFHLIKCEDPEKCLGKINKYARHQKETYQGFEGISFDEVQCVEFWKLQQWEHPLCDGDKLASIQACNYFCPFCPVTNKQFCKLQAWHTLSNKYKDHDFGCKQMHKESNQFNGLDIVFVIDTTASMGPMIENTKEIVKKIMKKAKLAAGKNIRFGVVAYRDHPPQDETYITKIQEMNDEQKTLIFLASLSAEGGGDYPEAVLDGLDAATKLSWLKNHDKMIFLIGDAPPHGLAYSDQSYWPQGCPCKISEAAIFRNMERLQISFKILRLKSGLNKMIKIFKELYNLEVLEENSTIDFVNQVVSKVCQQIKLREITYKKFD